MITRASPPSRRPARSLIQFRAKKRWVEAHSQPHNGSSNMALSGNTRELSLADLILVKAQDPGNFRLRLSGPAGDGLLLIRSGRVVHAAYGELPAADAAYLLVTEEAVDFNVEANVDIPGETVNFSAQELLMEAMRRFDEGVLKKPKSVAVTMGSGVSTRRTPPRPRSHDVRKSPEAEALRRAMGHFLFAEPETPTSFLRETLDAPFGAAARRRPRGRAGRRRLSHRDLHREHAPRGGPSFGSRRPARRSSDPSFGRSGHRTCGGGCEPPSHHPVSHPHRSRRQRLSAATPGGERGTGAVRGGGSGGAANVSLRSGDS